MQHIAGINTQPISLLPPGVEYLNPNSFQQLQHPLSIEDFTCPICLDIVNSPLCLPCKHTFCSDCLRKSILYMSSTLHCPCCHFMVQGTSNISVPCDFYLSLYKNLRLRCMYDNCTVDITLEQLEEHYQTHNEQSMSTLIDAQDDNSDDLTVATTPPPPFTCPTLPPLSIPSPTQTSTTPSHHIHQSTVQSDSPSQITLRAVLRTSVTKTPNETERRVASHLIKRMIHSSSQFADSTSLHLQTHGQVCMS